MSSFTKTTMLLGAILATLLGVAGLSLAGLDGIARHVLFWPSLAAAVLTAVALAGGVLVVIREHRRERGLPDLFWELTQLRREPALDQQQGFRGGPLRRALSRVVQGHDFLPGDMVEIKSLPEILSTLNADGSLGGMPFQPEMIRFCGQRVRVFRCLDKIYDYGRTRLMRRLPGSLLLSNLRCDGNAHGGCQASCYLIWRVEWLRHSTESSAAARGDAPADPALVPAVVAGGVLKNGMHRCQFTDLHACSREYGWQAWRKDLTPLVSGNYSLCAWLVALLTRHFNTVQKLRRGQTFPAMSGIGAHLSPEGPALSQGDRVVVRSAEEIARTLNRSGKNRGLWFDTDMIKHCGHEYRVQSRIERIIDDSNGQMRQMKSPCIALEGIDYSGEGLNFNAQHDPTFWRECWLRRVDEAR